MAIDHDSPTQCLCAQVEIDIDGNLKMLQMTAVSVNINGKRVRDTIEMSSRHCRLSQQKLVKACFL